MKDAGSEKSSVMQLQQISGHAHHACDSSKIASLLRSTTIESMAAVATPRDSKGCWTSTTRTEAARTNTARSLMNRTSSKNRINKSICMYLKYLTAPDFNNLAPHHTPTRILVSMNWDTMTFLQCRLMYRILLIAIIPLSTPRKLLPFNPPTAPLGIAISTPLPNSVMYWASSRSTRMVLVCNRDAHFNFPPLQCYKTKSDVAPYISQQKKSLAEAPAFEEFEVKLPTSISGSGSTVRIPPELMPSEEQCMEWFEIFFNHIHPYVPVISKPYFYQQWRSNRRSISPLILEAIFACAGRMSGDPSKGAQWLALASSEYFEEYLS